MLIRALVVLLLILNLGVALWWLTRGDVGGDDAGVDLPSGIARLQLVDETVQAGGDATVQATPAPPADAAPEAGSVAGLEDEPQADAAVVPVPAATATATRCYALGPFADRAAADGARAALPTGARPLRVREAAPANAPWRVVMPPVADREAATAMAGRLREAGFSDLFIVGEGAEANSIALGRFAGESAARNHAAALARAGFEARAEAIAPTRHWLDVGVAVDIDAATLRRATGAGQANASQCPAGAGASR